MKAEHISNNMQIFAECGHADVKNEMPVTKRIKSRGRYGHGREKESKNEKAGGRVQLIVWLKCQMMTKLEISPFHIKHNYKQRPLIPVKSAV